LLQVKIMDGREQRGLEIAATVKMRQKGSTWIVPKGCVAKIILSAEPNQPPISPVDYAAFNPRISRTNWNWICPRTSPFGNHLT
jgi:hypothetical protein